MRRDAQPDSDTNADEYEDEDEGTNLCSAFEISQHLLCHADGVVLQMCWSIS